MREMLKSKILIGFVVLMLGIVFIDAYKEKNAIERTNDIEVNYSQK